MSLITIIWSMVASACLTLAAMNVLVWVKKRTLWANLFISVMAAGTAGVAFGELSMMLAQTPAEFGSALRWTHLPLWVVIVSLVLFIRQYLRSGRPWLAWSVVALRTLSLILDFVFTPNLNYREISSLQHIHFLGESVSIAQGLPNPWMLVGQASVLLLAIFVVDAALTVRRRNDQRKALLLSSTVGFFVVASLVHSALVLWGLVTMPIMISFFFMGIVAAMAFEMSRDVQRAAQLSDDLRESEERLSLAAEAAGFGIWMWNIPHNQIWGSDKWIHLFGFPSAATVSFAEVMQRIHPDDRDMVEREVQRAVKDQADYTGEYRVILPDGTQRWIVARGRSYRDKNGVPARMLGAAIDITERKRIEDELEESRIQIEAVMNSTNDWIWSVDPVRFGLLTWNRGLADHFAKRVGLKIAVGMTPSDLLPPDRAARWPALYSRALREGSFTIEYHVTSQSNILLLSFNVMKQGGQVFGISVFGKDITEHKLAKAARREDLERFKAVVEGFDGFIYICSQDHRVEFMNKRMIERTGRNAAGELCYKALHDKDIVCEWCVNERVFQGETVRWEVQSPKDRRWYYAVNTPIYHVDGTMSKQSMIMDITDRKLAEQALTENEAALRSSKKDLQRLAGRLITAQEEELRRLSRELHDDLTQRLAVLAIEAGKLELDLNKMPERNTEAVHTVVQIKDQLIKVSEDVHTISRQLHPTILDDLGLVRAIESESAAFMRRNPVEVTFRKEHVPDALPDDIALCLYRVVQEGLKNIATHSGAKNCEVFLKGDEQVICLSVTDGGIGFDPRAVRNLPGLGLSSMRERVQLVQGDITIRSQPGKGTVINVCVPLNGSGI